MLKMDSGVLCGWHLVNCFGNKKTKWTMHKIGVGEKKKKLQNKYFLYLYQKNYVITINIDFIIFLLTWTSEAHKNWLTINLSCESAIF